MSKRVGQSGIYRIRNVVSGRTYIGSSINIDARTENHRSMLMRGRHTNNRLQADWFAYGPSCFLFETVELVEPSDEALLTAEVRHLATVHATGLSYNRLGQNPFCGRHQKIMAVTLGGAKAERCSYSTMAGRCSGVDINPKGSPLCKKHRAFYPGDPARGAVMATTT